MRGRLRDSMIGGQKAGVEDKVPLRAVADNWEEVPRMRLEAGTPRPWVGKD